MPPGMGFFLVRADGAQRRRAARVVKAQEL